LKDILELPHFGYFITELVIFLGEFASTSDAYFGHCENQRTSVLAAALPKFMRLKSLRLLGTWDWSGMHQNLRLPILGAISTLRLTADTFSEFELNFALMSRLSDVLCLLEALRGVRSVWLAIVDCKEEGDDLQYPVAHLPDFLSSTDSFSLSFLKSPTDTRGAWRGYAEDPAVWLKDSKLASLLYPPSNLSQLALPLGLVASLLPLCAGSLETLIAFGCPRLCFNINDLYPYSCLSKSLDQPP
jgi:hypothetical protein